MIGEVCGVMGVYMRGFSLICDGVRGKERDFWGFKKRFKGFN